MSACMNAEREKKLTNSIAKLEFKKVNSFTEQYFCVREAWWRRSFLKLQYPFKLLKYIPDSHKYLKHLPKRILNDYWDIQSCLIFPKTNKPVTKPSTSFIWVRKLLFLQAVFLSERSLLKKVFIGAEVCVIKELEAILEKIFIGAEVCVIKEPEIVFRG